MNHENILVVDDDPDILNFLRVYIESEGFSFYPASDFQEAIQIVDTHTIDLIILDVLLPQRDGFEICQDIRKRSNAPVIFLSCRNEELDIIMGLSVGADDYITKPFLPGELMARIRSNLRRSGSYAQNAADRHVIAWHDIELDLMSRQVRISGRPISLLPKEFDILALFLRNPNRVFTRDEIFEYIWKDQFIDSDVNTLTVHISNLRRKMDIGTTHPIITTVKGVGYKLTDYPG